VLVLEGLCDGLAGGDAERVAAEANLLQVGDVAQEVEVRLGLLERVELELLADEREEGLVRFCQEWGASVGLSGPRRGT